MIATSLSTSTTTTTRMARSISIAGPSRPPVQQIAWSSTAARRRGTAVAREGVDLVAPPDPVSNIRPIIYASTPSRKRSANSPYSATEFPSGLNERELEWRLRRERVDGMNHKFWSTMNMSFERSLEYRLSLLPAPSDPPSEADVRRREEALSRFYKDWQMSNQDAQVKWVKEWWRELWTGLRMQARIYWARALGRH